MPWHLLILGPSRDLPHVRSGSSVRRAMKPGVDRCHDSRSCPCDSESAQQCPLSHTMDGETSPESMGPGEMAEGDDIRLFSLRGPRANQHLRFACFLAHSGMG